MKQSFLWLATTVLLCACSSIDHNQVEKVESVPSTSLEILSAEQTGIAFRNNIQEGPEFHYFNYTYAYHGGGVAVGDINDDGLPDIYFTANQLPNKLYLNKGNLQFEDISESAGVGRKDGWTTGVTMVDANADGLLDIYVCMSGMFEDPATRENLLYINNGDNTFTEKAKEFGIAGNSHTTMAYFADLDGDADLDLYTVNHRVDWAMNTRVIVDPKFVPGPYETDRIYINNGAGKFEDQTEISGIKNKAWGLGAAIGDFNNDGYNDVYVANDFLEPDFLYVNARNGTFKERNTQYTRHISFYGMGVDWADFNNDALPDLCVLDMTPPDHKRSKQNMASMRPDQFFKMVEVG
ncbi:MAG: VCBS repeat-containing protein, partial [Flavobacteriales bacterium]|nr:VCBS repeat-containing protein [Flavobacteriales bacterium]